jgi:hypothetical protein
MTSLFMDVDVVTKFANWGLLRELSTVMGVGWRDVTTRQNIRHRARQSASSPDGKLFHSAEAANTVIELFQYWAPLSDDYNVMMLEELADIRGIDSGEAALLSYVVNDDDRLLLTGDKRAIRALAGTSFATQFAGRIIIIEQLLLLYLQHFGREWLLRRLCPNRELDGMLKVVFGANCDNEEPEIHAALLSYIDEVDKFMSPSLLWRLTLSPLKC